VPPLERRPRLLLRISGQDHDPKRRRRRGVSADRRKELTMTNIAGFLPLIYYFFTTLVYDTLDLGCWPQLAILLDLTIYYVAWRNCSRQFVTPLERGEL